MCAPFHFPVKVRAHANPLSDETYDFPITPDEVDVDALFPKDDTEEGPRLIEFCDAGCAWGGFLVKISPLYPKTLMLGMELRPKVAEWTKSRIENLRSEHDQCYGNINVVRANVMKHIPNYFRKGQLKKMFFMHPDPHFKNRNKKRRVISSVYLDTYAYALCVGGLLYTTTDVEELHEWMVKHLTEHPLFEAVPVEEYESDPLYLYIREGSEDGQKVRKSKGKLKSHMSLFRRIRGADEE